MHTFASDQLANAARFDRRTVLQSLCRLAAGTLIASSQASAATRFWDSKTAAQWTPEEIALLTSNSPWAKKVVAQYRAALEDLQPRREGQPTQGRGEATVGECGLVPCGNIMPGTVIVIWESAQPMREALRSPIAPEFNGRYVLSVRGLESELTTERLKQGSDLSAKGKPPVLPGVVGRRNNTLLFGFSRELLNLQASDRDVEFTVRTGPSFNATLLRATFNPKEMMYRGVLAL